MTDLAQLIEASSRVATLQTDLERYANDCAEARNWGGPTMYPRHPVTEDRARRDAHALQIVSDLVLRALQAQQETSEDE